MGVVLNEYLVVVQDKPGSFEERMRMREEHLSTLRTAILAQGSNGPITSGGPIAVDKDENLSGSCMTIVAESKEKVIDQLKKDVYYTAGVWDLDNVQIFAVSKSPLHYIQSLIILVRPCLSTRQTIKLITLLLYTLTHCLKAL